jgi:AcrR family transcriptional regulator
MKNGRVDIGSIRREQIVEAAVAVIAEKGLPNLSLSEIEKKAGMSRGQLTYYFPAKEDILLAVFDRLVELMYQRIGTPDGNGAGYEEESGWAWVGHLLDKLLARRPVSPEFSCLQYTFLSQMGHREDFRRRLATLHEEWRGNMAAGLERDLKSRRLPARASPRALASLVQAILHGLIMQLAANPNAFDRSEMLDLCQDILSSYLGLRKNEGRPAKKKMPSANGTHRRDARPRGKP